ncbi:MAG: formate C-acetyltransferase/glycerol dehydratase family glycyl radical enzyme [Eubacterium sp.]|nr:formate C-acetyltransferase/glycerol dehydratase family glycyl radical enzyme [Eubacterium sp.]
MTNRIKNLKEMQNKIKPSFSAERAKLATEAIKEYAFEPPVLQKAYMVAHILRNMTIFIQEGELIVGNHTDKPRCAPVFPEFNSQWIIDEIDDFPTRKSDPLQITPEDKATLLEVLEFWRGKSFEKIARDAIPAEMQRIENSGAATVGNIDCGTGHILPDYPGLLKNGYGYYRERCRQKIAETEINCKEAQEKVDFWKAIIIEVDAIEDWAKRYAELCEMEAQVAKNEERKQELLEMAEVCRQVPIKPARTFHEAIQLVWFTHLLVNIESNGHGNSYFTFDRYMNPFYVKDLAEGRITEERAIELIECFFIKNTDILKLRGKFYSASFAGYPLWQNIIVGGRLPDGTDATNETSFLCLKANADVRTSSPTMSVRVWDGSDQKLIDEGLKMIQAGMATPAFFNDNLVIPMVMDKHNVSLEDASKWGIFGCVQPCVPGYTDGRPTVGYVNILKLVELIMHNGVDPVTGEQLGPKTGDIHELDTLDKLKEALYVQLDYLIDWMLKAFNVVGSLHAVRQQMPFASMCINDCIEKGKSVQNGGARYSESGTFAVAIGNAVDALAAIDTVVYKKKLITIDELMEALACNFEGKEDIRQILLNKAPKYGNDDDYVDGIAADILRHYRETIEPYRDSRGGIFINDVESQSMNVSQGKCILATPDGRFAYDAVNDNCSPVMGRDVNGPTACINSVAKLDQKNCQDGCLYNLRFDPRSIQGEKGREVLDRVVKTYFKNMGEHIQINVVDDATLRAAQKEPENYRNLLVRVAGYLAYFTELDSDVQEAVIGRTAHRPD